MFVYLLKLINYIVFSERWKVGVYFVIYLKLKIALAIPASNEWKIPQNVSAIKQFSDKNKLDPGHGLS